MSTREVNAKLKVHLLEHGEMHPMSTKRERRFFEHGKYRFAEAAVTGKGLSDPLRYKPEWNRDNFVITASVTKKFVAEVFLFFAKG